MMKKTVAMLVLAALCKLAAAQTANRSLTENDAAVRAKDSLIKEQVIVPAWEASGDDAPDWPVLQQSIAKKYDAVTADRVVTKGRIYFYYNKDWALFCAGIVYYTDHYELAEDYKLLNLNAGMILNYSKDKAQLRAALHWADLAVAGDPANADYKKTVQSLKAKLEQ